MEELKELFGDGALTADEFTAKLQEKGIKLADISKGGYIAKEKFDRTKAEFDKYKAENDISKYADYDEIVKERDALKAEKEEATLVGKVSAAGVAAPFVKFVLSEVRGKVTDKVTIENAVEEYIKANPQYAEKQQAPIIRIPSQLAGNNGGAGEGSPDDYMNKQIRAALKK